MTSSPDSHTDMRLEDLRYSCVQKKNFNHQANCFLTTNEQDLRLDINRSLP